MTKNTKEHKESISISPAQAPTLAPAPSPESEFIEHGYGLYQNYEYPPTTTNPTNTGKFGKEKYVPAQELSKNNFNEFEMAYSNNNFHDNGNGNGNTNTKEYVNEKHGMSDTRFMENGNKYYYDVNQDVKDENRNEYVSERQGLSDTRFLENGKYYYDISEETAEKERNGHFHIINNANGDKNENLRDESDTRFMENGKDFDDTNEEEEAAAKFGKNGHFDVNNYEHENENKYNFNNNNVEYADSYYGSGKGNGNGNKGYDYKGNEYHVRQGSGNNNYRTPKKFPNEYDTMEEYDREQGYIEGKDEYVP